MLTTLFWLMYFMFSIVWAVVTGVVLLVVSRILHKYPFDYCIYGFRGMKENLKPLAPFFNSVRVIEPIYVWVFWNIPIVGLGFVAVDFINYVIQPFIVDPLTIKASSLLGKLIDPYLE